MERYMREKEDKFNIERFIGNLNTNDLVGLSGISSKGLTSLVENIIHEIMHQEKNDLATLIHTSEPKRRKDDKGNVVSNKAHDKDASYVSKRSHKHRDIPKKWEC